MMRFLPSPDRLTVATFRLACVLAILCAGVIGRSQIAFSGSGASTHTVTKLVTSNPHLHVATPPAAKPSSHTITVHLVPPIQISHSTWTPQWDAQHYIALHRGLGTIHGTTHDAAGKPVANVRLALQHPGGKPFANAALKHVTHSAANGTFTMNNVRPGTYRLYASIKPATAKLKKAFLRTVVRSDASQSVSIKI